MSWLFLLPPLDRNLTGEVKLLKGENLADGSSLSAFFDFLPMPSRDL